MSATYYTAILFFADPANVQRWPESYTTEQTNAAGAKPRKYRNIKNMESLQAFAARLGCIYINYYFKEGKNFSHKQWLTNFQR